MIIETEASLRYSSLLQNSQCVLFCIYHSYKILIFLVCIDFKCGVFSFIGLFKHHHKWRLQRDATQLLAFIVFAEFFVTTPDSISLPHLIVTYFRLPFECVTHWNVSPHSQPTLKGLFL